MQAVATFLDTGWDFVDETANGTEDIWWILEGRDVVGSYRLTIYDLLLTISLSARYPLWPEESVSIRGLIIA